MHLSIGGGGKAKKYMRNNKFFYIDWYLLVEGRIVFSSALEKFSVFDFFYFQK